MNIKQVQHGIMYKEKQKQTSSKVVSTGESAKPSEPVKQLLPLVFSKGAGQSSGRQKTNCQAKTITEI